MKCVLSRPASATMVRLSRSLGQREIGVAGEFAGQEFGRVDHHLGRAVLDRGENLARAGNHDVAAEHEIGAARGDADGVNLFAGFRRCGCG